MEISDLPAVNATLNSTCALLLSVGLILIKSGRRKAHQRVMIAALFTSLLFLTTYLVYHFNVGSVAYPYYDWTRPIYFAILIPHVILAVVMTPFILLLVFRALRGEFDRHKRLQ